MKKKIISLLLTVVMIVSMASVLTVNAFAEPTVTIVQVAQGDTVISICKKYGFDYYSYKKLVMALNNVSDESEFSKIKVGGYFAVPVSEAAAKTLASATASITITPGNAQTSSNTAAAKTPGIAASIPGGDSVGYYIVQYTFESGDTVNNVYKSWGLGYKTYTNQILKLNNISSFNKIGAGKQMLLPTTVVKNSADVVYTVMAHKMASGETVYNVVTTGYGMDYKTNQELLQTINGKDNLAAFKAGEILYIPVSGTVSVETPAPSAK